MSTMEKILRLMSEKKASDVYLSARAPALIKINGICIPINNQELPVEAPLALLSEVVKPKAIEELKQTGELNMAIPMTGIGRFRISAMRQRGSYAVVVRFISYQIPSRNELNLPAIVSELVMEKRGLVLVVGGTGSGKSTSLAALIDYRNEHSAGHIITVEDPVEYVHKHKKSMITHREVGVDCHSWHNALKNTLRQAPDVILIGEIRDTETMEHAIAFAETGHLCLGTLHSNNANQTLDRIINFFPEERRNQLLMDLSSNMKAIISQRLIRTEDGKGRRAAVEIMLNTPLISDLILKGEFHELKAIMGKSRELGMQTFDQALFDLYNDGAISYEEALRNADSMNELRLQIKLKSPRANPAMQNAAAEFSMQADEKAESDDAQQAS